jgi:hypothetical protein
MGHNIQICVDSHDPHVQADWWAETLGWSVEPSDEAFIRDMVAQGHATEAQTREYRGTLVWREGAAICPTEQVGKKPRQRILFQEVPEPKTVKNRVHWDLNLDGQDKDEVRAALEARGATFLHEGSQGPFAWYTMRDPEGNEFCFG